MKIHVYGTGCASCKNLYEVTKEAVAELGIQAEVEYITDIQKMVEIGLLQSPALVINDYVAHVGSVPDNARIKELLLEEHGEVSKEAQSCSSCGCGGKC